MFYNALLTHYLSVHDEAFVIIYPLLT